MFPGQKWAAWQMKQRSEERKRAGLNLGHVLPQMEGHVLPQTMRLLGHVLPQMKTTRANPILNKGKTCAHLGHVLRTRGLEG